MDHSSSSAAYDQAHVQRLIKPFYVLLNDLSNDVDNDCLQELCVLCRSLPIPDERFKCDTALELFRKLDKYGSIGEDNTEFLKEILEKASHIVGVDMVKYYETERREHLKNVEDMLGINDPLFVGRTAFVRKILEVFQDSHSDKCRCVLVYGLAGTGKTKLAVESCALYKKQQVPSMTRLVRVNLHKATRNNEVWLWTLRSLTGKQISYKQFDITLFKDWILNCPQDTIIYLDNADAILNSSSDSKSEFIQTLCDVLSLKKSLAKILITSRHPVDLKDPIDIPHFVEIKLEPLTDHESTVLLNKMVTRASTQCYENLRDERSLVEIARLCGRNPQALRAVASRLSSGFKPKELAEHLQRFDLVVRVLEPGLMAASAAFQGIEDQQMVLKSLNAMYEQLAQPIQKALLKLTVFPSSFTLKQAAKILDHEDLALAEYDLDDLKKWSLVEQDQPDVFEIGRSDKEPYYYVHPLVRFVCLTKVQSSTADREDYEGALCRFIDFVTGLIKTLTKLGHQDFPQALAEYELNTTNVLHFLEIDMGKIDSRLTDGQHDLQESLPLMNTREGFYSMFQTFLDPFKRLEYYKMKSEQMLRLNEVVGWAYLKGWVADEQVERAQFSEASKTIKRPLELVTGGTTIDSQRAKAKLLYVKGRICSESEGFREAIDLLEEALSINQRLLGNHTITARCLNALGHAYYNEAEENRVETGDKALEYHTKAFDMLEKITHGDPKKHFDAPEYLLNIGSSYHQAGKNICHDRKGHDLFRLAIKTYKEALDLAESLKLTKLSSTAYMKKNIAMSHYEMGEYEVALPWAKAAGQIREATCIMHPATARNLYFIGSLHEKIGDQLKKAGKTQESGQQLLDGLEYFKRALKVEFQLEKHSSEYDYLKKDTIALLKKLHLDKDVEIFLKRFQREDDKSISSTDGHTTASYLEDGVQVSMHQRPHGSVIEIDADDSNGEEAGVSQARKRKTPGPVLLEESPNKICKCC